jgi:hypothetical protein
VGYQRFRLLPKSLRGNLREERCLSAELCWMNLQDFLPYLRSNLLLPVFRG